ncbi:Cationic amino acid transporter 1 [Bienertia sinuspersici]
MNSADIDLSTASIVIFLPKSKGDKKKSLLGDTKSSTEDETKSKDQKNAVEKGLVTLDDVEMAAADG